MAKTKGTKAAQAPAPGGEGETTSGYFRRIIRENPKLLKKGSNAALLERWLKDHPGEKEVPKNVQAILHNLKSFLRKRRRQLRADKAQTAPDAVAATAPASSAPAAPRRTEKGLAQLEDQIDDCLASARGLDREGLSGVIELLRRARNQVVRQAGLS
jgi:hypothetical protein